MFEDFRKQTDEKSFVSEKSDLDDIRDEILVDQPKQHFLGMTPFQRFALVCMLFLMTCVLAILFLLITQRIVPPIFG